ncbi:hypothetical protein ACHWQZ_G014483 [Mnemiopsis leidyi]
MSDRIKSFKNKGWVDADDARRRRKEGAVELRKEKRNESMLKRRNIPLEDFHNETAPQSDNKDLQSLVREAQSSDPNVKLSCVQQARKELSKGNNPPIDELIRAGIVPILVECLDDEENAALQFEATWALTNIASGNSDQTREVVTKGAVPKFVRLLSSPHEHVREQSVWALGNIIGDGPECRDFVIHHGVVDPVISFVKDTTQLTFLRNIVWVIANLCRNKDPPPAPEVVQKVLPALFSLVQHTDNEVLTDACWALSYLTDGADDQIQNVLNSGVAPYLVQHLGQTDVRVLTPAVRAVGNIVTGSENQTQAALDCGCLTFFPALLQHHKESIKKEAVWTISNITAGSKSQIQAVIDHGLIPLVINALETGDFNTQKEAAWSVSNMTVNGTPEQIKYLIEQQAVRSMCALLGVRDPTIVQVLLDGLNNMLETSKDDCENICRMIEDCGGLDRIEDLQKHQNKQIYKLAFDIIDKYFSSEDYLENDEENFNFQINSSEQQLAPEGGFNF